MVQKVEPGQPFFFLFVAVLTTAAISKFLAGARLNIQIPRFCLEHLRMTGIWSYSIYLLHQPLVGIASNFPALFLSGLHIQPLLKFLCCLVSWLVIMPLGGLWYRFFELPSIALGKVCIRKSK